MIRARDHISWRTFGRDIVKTGRHPTAKSIHSPLHEKRASHVLRGTSKQAAVPPCLSSGWKPSCTAEEGVPCVAEEPSPAQPTWGEVCTSSSRLRDGLGFVGDTTEATRRRPAGTWGPWTGWHRDSDCRLRERRANHIRRHWLHCGWGSETEIMMLGLALSASYGWMWIPCMQCIEKPS